MCRKLRLIVNLAEHTTLRSRPRLPRILTITSISRKSDSFIVNSIHLTCEHMDASLSYGSGQFLTGPVGFGKRGCDLQAG